MTSIHWLADYLILSAAVTLFVIFWGIAMYRNTPKTPREQFDEDRDQQEQLARWKKAA